MYAVVLLLMLDGDRQGGKPAGARVGRSAGLFQMHPVVSQRRVYTYLEVYMSTSYPIVGNSLTDHD